MATTTRSATSGGGGQRDAAPGPGHPPVHVAPSLKAYRSTGCATWTAFAPGPGAPPRWRSAGGEGPGAPRRLRPARHVKALPCWSRPTVSSRLNPAPGVSRRSLRGAAGRAGADGALRRAGADPPGLAVPGAGSRSGARRLLGIGELYVFGAVAWGWRRRALRAADPARPPGRPASSPARTRASQPGRGPHPQPAPNRDAGAAAATCVSTWAPAASPRSTGAAPPPLPPPPMPRPGPWLLRVVVSDPFG
jgi:hypothetical protein